MGYRPRSSTVRRASMMRVYVKRILVAGGELPTAQEVVTEVGGSTGLAIRVLHEFPAYMGGPRMLPRPRGCVISRAPRTTAKLTRETT